MGTCYGLGISIVNIIGFVGWVRHMFYVVFQDLDILTIMYVELHILWIYFHNFIYDYGYNVIIRGHLRPSLAHDFR